VNPQKPRKKNNEEEEVKERKITGSNLDLEEISLEKEMALLYTQKP
jgi:hypothetical protein